MAEGTLTGTVPAPPPPGTQTVTGTNGTAPLQEHWAKKTFSQDFNNRHFDKFQSFENPDKVGESYIALQTKMSQTGRLPTADAPREEWDTFRKAWGVPDEPGKYAIAPELKSKAGNDEFLATINTMAHNLGLNQKQYEQMVSWGVQQADAIEAQKKAATAAGLTSLRAEWGFAFDQNVGLAQRALMTLVDGNKNDPFVKFLDETGLSDHPAAIKFFARIGKDLGEDELIKGDGSSSATDKESAMSQINEIRSDPKHPFNDTKHLNHKRAVDEMQELYKVVYA